LELATKTKAIMAPNYESEDLEDESEEESVEEDEVVAKKRSSKKAWKVRVDTVAFAHFSILVSLKAFPMTRIPTSPSAQ
jgi:hypothetical protein